jgi:hypothetical protein
VGNAIVTFLFEDDGQNGEANPRDVKITPTSTFGVRVFPTNDPPSFKLPFAISSASCAIGVDCSCSPFEKSSRCAALNEFVEESHPCAGAHVQLAQQFQGQTGHVVRGFAAGITTANGYQPSALTLFAPQKIKKSAGNAAEASDVQPNEDAAYANFTLHRTGADPLGAVDSLQLAVHTALSPDGRHLYAAEAETDSISVHELRADGSSIRFVDRLTQGKGRLSFEQLPVDNTSCCLDQYDPVSLPYDAMQNCTSFNVTNETVCIPQECNSTQMAEKFNISVSLPICNLTNATHNQVQVHSCRQNVSCTANPSVFSDIGTFATTFVCGLEVFASHGGNETFVAAASGCQSLAELSVNFLPAPSPCLSKLTAECGYECCMAVENATIGLWDFTEHSISGAKRRPNTFRGGDVVVCSHNNCSYSRSRNLDRCSERHGTWYFQHFLPLMSTYIIVSPRLLSTCRILLYLYFFTIVCVQLLIPPAH